ncbi:TerC family protein [Calidithermus roseus]|uniref:Integral membrane protein, YkoY family n=1 Tax=Calidithermus roseus TaxID=1644118 RepID=A0A399EQQ4_9DEIN|nr:hypothetical protein [Calidithermus roseus]RIH86195.1 integral membrane protein, YkoY family [Calidithermus roseus]
MGLAEAILAIVIIVALEAILSVDNAMVLAVMVKPLPPELRKRALLYGIIGAYILRGLALLFATLIINIWWIQVLGGIYLIYLAVKFFLNRQSDEAKSPEQALGASVQQSFWRIVVMLNVVDLAFAIDSVLVVVAFSKVFWVIFTGVAIGILLIRLAAGWMVRVMEHYPKLETVAYTVVGWAGIKLALEGWNLGAEVWLHNEALVFHLPKELFLGGTLLILVAGTLWALRSGDRSARSA